MSHYTVSNSESSSFCTNTAPHSCTRAGEDCPEPYLVSVSKRTHKHASAGAAADSAFDEEAAVSAYSDSAAKKASQLAEAAATMAPQESPSMTIRRAPADYTKRMEDLKARSSALERYKLLVRGSRLVKGAPSSPNPTEAKEESRPSTRRNGAPCHTPNQACDSSTVDETVVSDDSEAEEEDPPLPGSQSRPSACKPASSPNSRRMPPRARSSLSPVSMERPTEPAGDKMEGSLTNSSPLIEVPRIELFDAHGSSSLLTPACTTKEQGDAQVHYVAPELTLPYCASSKRRRYMVRPGYEPVTAHGRTSLQRTFTASLVQTDGSLSTSSPRVQPRSLTRRGTSASTCHASTAAVATPSSNQLTRRRTSGTVNMAPETAATTSVSPERNADEKAVEESGATAATSLTSTSPASRCVAMQLFQRGDKAVALRQRDAEEDVAEGRRASTAETESKKEPEGILLSGSQAAFWLRPSTAMYEMTASIAAKRKDHYGDEEERRSTPSRRNQNPSRPCTANASTTSSCGTPRSCTSITSEAKPRFTTHMTARRWERHGECSAAVPSGTAITYDSIYSLSQSTVRKGAFCRPRQRVSVEVSSENRTCDSPRRTSHHQPKRRAVPQVCSGRSSQGRPSCTLSPLSSGPATTASSSEVHRAIDAGRVSTRQQNSFSKHCAGVAARNSLPEDSAGAAVRQVKRSKRRVVAAAAGESPAKDEAPASLKPEINKKLHFESEDEPVPRKTVPQCTGCVVNLPVEPALETLSPGSTVHLLQAPCEGSPYKSCRREHDLTGILAGPNDHADTELHLAAQKASMEREGRVSASQTRTAPESCRQARHARMDGPQASYGTNTTTTSTNEVVAAMLQGIVQQTRQTLPCFLCADQQATSAYRVHVDRCRPKAEALLREYYATDDDTRDLSAALVERIQHMASQEVPSATSSEPVRDAFARECYQCVKAMLVACRKCGVRVRVQDIKEHEMLCGRACYLSSRAAERVRATVERIEHGSQD
ncbi:hypothetical protein CUR178_02394 [Leishmania enriettii]|uniref:Uncharacterized protein n=1 Tax=Leishmania enriettii TaxID=5663 RepID=A0A836H540_LEIEN|nr:hypothetical protein CUR178_02394 [Leishmania enriettii]